MRFIFVIILAVLLGYGVFQLDEVAGGNYVKMYLGNYVIELKVVAFLVLVLVVAVLAYFAVWLIRRLLGSPKSVSRWWHRRSRDIAEEQFGAGYLSLINGDWRRAESQLTKKSGHSHISFVNYLAAARAAAEQGRLSKRDEYLQAAYQAAPKERLAIALTKAKLHERAGQIEEAEATLEDVRELGKNNPQYTAMRIQLFEQIQDWKHVSELLPMAKKQKALPMEMLNEIGDLAVTSQLKEEQNKSSAFESLSKDQRKRPANVAVLAQDLLSRGKQVEVEKLIRSTLKSSWSDDLVDLYGQIEAEKPSKLLRQVEGWLNARPENPHLHLAAGRLAQAEGSFDKAKEHLQTSIKLGRLPEAYTVLGEIFEETEELGNALKLYRSGMHELADGVAGDDVVSEPELIVASADEKLPASS